MGKPSLWGLLSYMSEMFPSFSPPDSTEWITISLSSRSAQVCAWLINLNELRCSRKTSKTCWKGTSFMRWHQHLETLLWLNCVVNGPAASLPSTVMWQKTRTLHQDLSSHGYEETHINIWYLKQNASLLRTLLSCISPTSIIKELISKQLQNMHFIFQGKNITDSCYGFIMWN